MEGSKKRWVAIFVSRRAMVSDIHCWIDLGENERNVAYEDIRAIAKDAGLGEGGGRDISPWQVEIRPLQTLEEFATFCEQKRAKLKQEREEYLKNKEQTKSEIEKEEEKKRERARINREDWNERKKKREAARKGKDMVFEIFEGKTYLETFDNIENAYAFLVEERKKRINDNLSLKPWYTI